MWVVRSTEYKITLFFEESVTLKWKIWEFAYFYKLGGRLLLFDLSPFSTKTWISEQCSSGMYSHIQHMLSKWYLSVCKGKGKAVTLQAWTGPEGSQISWHRRRMVVGCQPYAPAAFTPRKCSWYSFLLEAECDRKNFMSMKNPLTQLRIEPATSRFVAQNLNHCATAVSYISVFT